MKWLALCLMLTAQSFAANWFVSTTGNNGSACTSTGTACLTINGAYQKATNGDHIELASGTYGGQTMASHSALTTTIIVEPVSGGTVTLGDLSINSATRLEFRRGVGAAFTTEGFTCSGTGQYVTLRDVDVDGWLGYTGCNDITMINGSVGPLLNAHAQIAPVSGWGTQGNRFIFDGVRFHDIIRNSEAVHIECLQVAGTTDMIIRNSKFENCDVFDLSFTTYNGAGQVTNLLLENNWFKASTNINGTGNGSGSVHLTAVASATIRFNSSSGYMWAGAEHGPIGLLALTGNNISGGFLSGDSGGCLGAGDATYLYNVTSGWDCSASDVNASQGFVNASAFDLNLTSSATARDFVPTGVSGGCPATDIAGISRPQSTNCDAGASEYNTGGGGAPPGIPTSLAATAGDTQVSLSCTSPSGASQINFKRGVSGGPYTAFTSPSVCSAIDTGRTNGTQYCYVASASNAFGESANTSQQCATPTAAAPGTPTGLSASAGNGQVVLDWPDTLGATSYTLQRSLTGGGAGFSIIASPTASTYTDTGRTNGTQYFYRVSATNASGTSGYSTEDSATPGNCATSDTGWGSFQGFVAQTGTFIATWTATPNDSLLDGVTGLSDNQALAYEDTAVAVRFNNAGEIDSINGGVATYAADNVVSYVADDVFAFRAVVNVATKTYSLWVAKNGGAEVQIASDSDFRSTQSAIAEIDTINFHEDAFFGSETKSYSVCDVVVSTGGAKPLAPTGLMAVPR